MKSAERLVEFRSETHYYPIKNFLASIYTITVASEPAAVAAMFRCRFAMTIKPTIMMIVGPISPQGMSG
jgi:hypothetical protein